MLCRPAAPIKYAGVPAAPISSPLVKAGNLRSGFWGMKTRCSSISKASVLSFQTCGTKGRPTRCSFSSSSDGNGSRAGNFSENDEEYVNSSVIEAGNLFFNKCNFSVFTVCYTFCGLCWNIIILR